ncbi:hypothetical protein FSP39_004215 [Pinctada imbricata]|uniref:FZ domain-containing protein n=1 Tax=Pinctada imbricata TaxID=66713 RepID=A0AA88Y943_PINIB|nr:hypothetical protein FSP39_004215 [Pinctada imbricata]
MVLKVVLFVILLFVSCDVVEGDCEEIMVPMCRGLVGYTHTKLPNKFNHTTQTEVYSALEKFWPVMDSPCSGNFRLLACGTYLPKCTTNRRGVDITMEPCKVTCMRAKGNCKQTITDLSINPKWPDEFKCRNYVIRSRRRPRQPRQTPRRRRRRQPCIPPLRRREERSRTTFTRAYCDTNAFSMCQNITFLSATLPNHFNQTNRALLEQEMLQYEPIFDCHPNFRFLLCGVFMPFCMNENSLAEMSVLPCNETCLEVRNQCRSAHEATFGGIPWPGKLQCHRLPSGSNRQRCATPTDPVFLNI